MNKTYLVRSITVIAVLLSFSSNMLAGVKPYMGIYLADLSSKDYEKLGIEEGYGVEVQKVVAESPAAKAGILEKDVILTLAGEKVYTHDQLVKMLSLFKPEQVVKLNIMRAGKKEDINLTLGERKVLETKKKAFLGVYLNDLDEDDYKKKEIPDQYGVLIDKIVKDGPADKAGIKDGDIIKEIDKEKIYTSDQVSKMLGTKSIGQQVNVQVVRKGKNKEFTVELGEKDYGLEFFFGDESFEFINDPGNVLVYRYFDKTGKWLGIKPMELNDQLIESYGIPNGVMIKEVIADTPAEEAGLKAGDIIIKIEGNVINKSGDISEIISEKEAGEEVDIELQRDKKIKTIKVKVGLKKNYPSEERIEVSVDAGDVKILIDGEEEFIYNLQNSLGELQKLKELKGIDQNIELEIQDEMKKLQEELEATDTDLKIINTKLSREI